MIQYKKIIMTLALLLTAVTGAWAQSTEPTEWELTSQDGKVWTLAKMPANDIELQVEYFAESNLFLSKDALANKANIAVKNGETAVTFDDAGKSANTVTEGNTVTVTYTGTKKIIGVKAEKKEKASASPVVGQIIGSDGKNYDANATLPDGVKAVALIAYVGSDNGENAPYNHGLALALSDANDGNACTWNTSNTDAGHTKQTNIPFTEESGLQYNDATHNSDTYPAFQAAIANNGTAAPTGCSSWFLASGYQWQMMLGANGYGLENLKNSSGSYIGLQENAGYWLSTESTARYAWSISSRSDWFSRKKDTGYQVRACLAF